MYESDNTGSLEVFSLSKHSHETILSTKDSSLDLIHILSESPYKVIEASSILKVLVNRIYNYTFSLVKKSAKAKHVFEKPSNKLSILSLHHKRTILMKAVKKMLWNGHIKLSQRPFWIWKMLMEAKPEKKITFFDRNKKLILRAFFNRLLKFHFFRLKSKFDNFRLRVTELADFNYPKKFNEKIRSKKITQLKKNPEKKGLKTILMIFNLFALKKLNNYWNEWKQYDPGYTQFTEEVKSKELHIRNFKLLQKPKIELIYYDRVSITPGIQSYFNCFSHLYKNTKESALWQLSNYLKPSKEKITYLNAWCFLNIGSTSSKLWRVVKNAAKKRELDTPRKIKVFGFKRAPFLHVYKINKLELIFLRGQYYTQVKKMLYG